MYTAIQQMASTIAKLETGFERDPNSFDVLELLDKHAPHSIIDDEEDPSLPSASSRPNKRRRDEHRLADSTTATPVSSGWQSGHVPNTSLQNPMPFELRPAPTSADAGAQNSSQAYETMMMLYHYVNDSNTRSMADPNASLTPMPVTEASYGTEPMISEQNAVSSASYPTSNMAQLELMNLVDWEMSLANLQNTHDFVDMTENATSYTDQMM